MCSARPNQERLVLTLLYRRTHNCFVELKAVFDGQQLLGIKLGAAVYQMLAVNDQMSWREQQPEQIHQVQVMKGGVLHQQEVSNLPIVHSLCLFDYAKVSAGLEECRPGFEKGLEKLIELSRQLSEQGCSIIVL